MFLSSVTLKDFRNIEEVEVGLTAGVNLFRGNNGVGKTTLLEAVYCLGTGKSFREAQSAALIRDGCEEARLFCRVEEPDGSTQLELQIHKKHRKVKINGEFVKQMRDFWGALLVVSFSPDDIAIFKGGPTLRRRLVDKVVVDLYPVSAADFSKYQRALKQKTLLLKQRALAKQVDPWNVILAEAASRIVSYRREVVELLKGYLSVTYRKFMDPSDSVSVSYLCTLKDASSSSEIYESFTTLLSREISAGRVLQGPHLDDFEFSINGLTVRSYASQGQARSLALSVKLATATAVEARTKRQPILLLDDVDSELDQLRRDRLFRELASITNQIFISTASDIGLFKAFKSHEREVARFCVSPGKFLRADI